LVKNDAAPSPFSKFLHVGLVVKDLDIVVDRLQSLGVGPFGPLSLPPLTEKQLYRGEPCEIEVQARKASVGDFELEIFEPADSKSPQKEFLDNKGEGIHHLAFAVDDLDKYLASWADAGCEIILSAKCQGGQAAYLDLGTGGIIVELMQL
jgi:methylmalonyl-CoA/ethylmalonyl-CoA epimerase